MARSSRTRSAAKRASFARAERLRREAAERGDLPRRGQERQGFDTARTFQDARAPERQGSRQDKHRRRDRSRQTPERESIEQKRNARAAAFNASEDRRKQADRRTISERKRQEVQRVTRRFQEQRQAEQRKRDDQRRDRSRRDFAQNAARRQDHARRATIQQQQDRRQQEQKQQTALAAAIAQEAQKRATALIDAEHKRQRDDQQAAQRWHAAQSRTRHQRVMDSLYRNQDCAAERHICELNSIHGRRSDALLDFDNQRRSLTGRIAEAIPGGRARNVERRAEIARSFDAEETHSFQKLEALQERQAVEAQRVRLANAKELLAMAGSHITERKDLQDRQRHNKPALVKAQARVIQRVDREQTLEARRGMRTPDRERERLMQAFGKE